MQKAFPAKAVLTKDRFLSTLIFYGATFSELNFQNGIKPLQNRQP